MLTPFTDLLSHALENHYAIAYFEAWDIYSLEAVLEAAEEVNIPIILGFGGAMIDPNWMNNGAIERLGAIGLSTAKSAKVPVALILNEVKSFKQIVRGINSGFNAVMLDTSDLPFEENVYLTAKVTEIAHAVDVGVEAELGVLPSGTLEVSDDCRHLTDPSQAAEFVSRTGIDALSVSIGNTHLLEEGYAEIDCDLLAAIHKAVDIPLVVHGGSGFPEDIIPAVISLGVAKVNIGTCMKTAFLQGITDAIQHLPESYNIQDVMGSRKPADVLQQGKLYTRREITRRIKLWYPELSKEMLP